MNLDEIIFEIKKAHADGCDVARVHSGDPSIYGAIGEQMRRLDVLKIPYDVTPGVSAYSAAAAEIKCELTLPGVSQSVILTRTAVRSSAMPNEEDLKQYCWNRLESGRVIPGYGHAVLRCADPRFSAFIKFGQQNINQDDVFGIVDLLYKVVPGVLKEHGKAKNPWPNVDAASGSLLYYYGLKEFKFYTVLFSISRTMGMISQMVWERALGIPITRPKSVTTNWIKTNL